MPLYRPSFLVEYDPTAEPVRVQITTGDMMRAELEHDRLHLPKNANFHLTGLWLWSALVRAGLEDRKAAEFLADPPEFEPIKRDDGSEELAVEPVDPTLPGAGGLASGVPATTVTQVSG